MPASKRTTGRPVPTTQARREEARERVLAACRLRFAPPAYEVDCDANGTVWVKETNGLRSFGVQPWLWRDHSTDEVMARIEASILAPARSGAPTTL